MPLLGDLLWSQFLCFHSCFFIIIIINIKRFAIKDWITRFYIIELHVFTLLNYTFLGLKRISYSILATVNSFYILNHYTWS